MYIVLLKMWRKYFNVNIIMTGVKKWIIRLIVGAPIQVKGFSYCIQVSPNMLPYQILNTNGSKCSSSRKKIGFNIPV